MSEQGASEKTVEAAAKVQYELDSVSINAVGDRRTSRWSMASESEGDDYRADARKVLLAALPELEAEWRERLLSDEAIVAVAEAQWNLDEDANARRTYRIPWADADDQSALEYRDDARQVLEAAIAATHPHSGQPGDQGSTKCPGDSGARCPTSALESQTKPGGDQQESGEQASRRLNPFHGYRELVPASQSREGQVDEGTPATHGSFICDGSTVPRCEEVHPAHDPATSQPGDQGWREPLDVYGTVGNRLDAVAVEPVLRTLLVDDGRWLAACDDNAAVVQWLRGAVQAAYQGRPLPLLTVDEVERRFKDPEVIEAALAAAAISPADLANVVRTLLDSLAGDQQESGG